MFGPRQAEEHFRSAFEYAAVGTALLDLDGRWIRVNPSLGRLLGYAPEELVGQTFAELTHPDDVQESVEALHALIAGELSAYQIEQRYLHADGHSVWVSMSVSLVRDASGHPVHLIAQMQDISDRKAFEHDLAARALRDPLTGLPNRVLFLDRMQVALARAERPHSPVAALFVDLDRFKLVNDSFGHAAGDRLLEEVADRLASQVRPSDTVARFGGDEFTVLCEGTDEHSASAVAARIAEALSRPFALGEHEISLGASIGVAVTRDPDADPESLLRDADLAMYRAKREGGARFALFEGGMRFRAPGSTEEPVNSS